MIKFIFAAVVGSIAVLAQATHPPSITSISVCSPTGKGGQGSCPVGTSDTLQVVVATGGSSINNSPLGFGAAPDEHSTIFAPGTLGSNQDYLFFLASAENGHPGIGVGVLSGGSGPNNNGQWVLDFPRTDGYGAYSGGFGQVFNPSSSLGNCPVVADGNPAHQDQTFDMHYAAPGSIVQDPTAAPGALLMVYEGTNACIGNAGGAVISNTDDYISLAIATSMDYGKSWPTYRGTPTFNFVPLPGVNSLQSPNAPMGALGKNVCIGNDCTTTAPASYGRYPVVTPPVSLASLMAAALPLTAKTGEQEISGFVDDIAGGAAPYLYATFGNARIARAQLKGGTAPLTFQKWNGQAFSSPGLGGAESSVLPAGAFANCEAPTQSQYGSSISYVEPTQQYLLTFVCVSGGDPALGKGNGGAQGGAWFYSTSYDLSDPTQWTPPLEITGSWSDFDQSGGCPYWQGYYPSFMSLGTKTGHLSTTGYVFSLWGCQGATPPPGRQFASRQFTITLSNPLPPVVPQSGWWWDPSLSGMGFFIESGGQSGSGLFMAGFFSDASGSPTWLVSTGLMSGSTYTGTWLKASGGQALLGPYRNPTLAAAGAVSITFSDATHAVLKRPDGSTINIQRYPFFAPTVALPESGTPEVGWWWGGSALSGSGYAIEFQGNSVFVAAYVYDAAGSPVWYLATGSLTSPTQYTGTWDSYAGGPQLTSPEGAYPSHKTGSASPLTLTFTDSTHGTITMGTTSIPILRYRSF